MDELSALDMIYDTSVPDLWDDLKFTDTDEDWSVSESSSDSGNFNLDPLDVDSCNDLLPETKVQDALCNLDLLASNTTSALSLPPFADADMDGLEGPEPAAPRDSKALRFAYSWSGASAKDDQPQFASLSSRAAAAAAHASHLPQLQHQPQTLNNAQTQPAMPLSHDVAVHPAPALAAALEDDERPAPVPATPTFRAASLCTAGSQSPGTGLHKKRKIAGITPTPSVVKLPAGPAAAAHDVAKLASRNTRIKLEAAHAPANAACGLAHRVHSAGVREASTGSACAAKRTVTAKAGNRCEFCLEKFDTTDALQKHRQKHILGNSHFTCTFPDCKKHYATGEGLRLHVRNVHLMAKNWKCLADGCSRSFVRQSDLRMHIIRMHSDIRPFPCPVQACEKSFACHSELRRHVHSCHKLPCPKPEKVQSKTNFVDPSFIQALMLKTE